MRAKRQLKTGDELTAILMILIGIQLHQNSKSLLNRHQFNTKTIAKKTIRKSYSRAYWNGNKLDF
jgi:hypothetical protein